MYPLLHQVKEQVKISRVFPPNKSIASMTVIVVILVPKDLVIDSLMID